MIKRDTAKALKLKPITQKECYDFYLKVYSEFKKHENIKKSILLWEKDCEKLNNLWWILNYYSAWLDHDRKIRATIEKQLEKIHQKANKKEFCTTFV